jgi:hypothetical protein
MNHLFKFWRDTKIIFKAVGRNLLIFACLIVLTVVLLQISKSYPGADWLELLVNAFHLAIMQRVIENSQGTLALVLSLLLPLLTLFLVGEGFLRFVSIYINRKDHKKEWDELMVTTYSGHIVVCGVGELGKAIFHRIVIAHPKLQAALIELKPDVLADLGLIGDQYVHIQADMTDINTLNKANCSKAKMIIISSGSDTINLETALKVFGINPIAEIWIRLNRSDLVNLMDLTKKPNFHFFCPYQQAADVLVKELVK